MTQTSYEARVSVRQLFRFLQADGVLRVSILLDPPSAIMYKICNLLELQLI